MMNLLMFPFGIGAVIFLGIGSVVLFIWSLLDCLNSKLSIEEKLLWIFLMVSFTLIGTLVYLIAVKANNFRLKPRKTRLVRGKDKVIAGVCAGFADYFGIDRTALRILYVIFTFFTGFWIGMIMYFVSWAVMPEK